MGLLNRRQLLQTAAVAASANPTQTGRWLETAERLKPRLHATLVAPVDMVKPVADASRFCGGAWNGRVRRARCAIG